MAFLTAVIGYLLGSIPFTWMLGHLAGVDLRTTGTGSAGAANLAAAAGRGVAAVGLILDAAKGAGAVLLGGVWGAGPALLAGFGVVVGHGWPIWLGLSGGRSQAVALAAGAVIAPWGTLAVLPVLGIGYFSRRLAVSWLAALIVWPIVAGLADGGVAIAYTAGAGVLTIVLRLRGSSHLSPRPPLRRAWRWRLLYDRDP